MRSPLHTLVAVLALGTLGAAPVAPEPGPSVQIVRAADVEFIPLNPARGDASPRSGALWGNIREDVPSGSLVRFVDGFQSPPHIHNITYRAVVIRGAVHNDDPDAGKMWMESGSFWTQPAGENHITAARGADTMIFLEILSGPYLVKPAEEAFDGGERPVNVDAGNLVWLDATETTRIVADGPAVAWLWGRPDATHATFLRLPAGFEGVLESKAPLLRAVTIQGTTEVRPPDAETATALEPGSYLRSRGEAAHRVACTTAAACLLYLHADGDWVVRSR